MAKMLGSNYGTINQLKPNEELITQFKLNIIAKVYNKALEEFNATHYKNLRYPNKKLSEIIITLLNISLEDRPPITEIKKLLTNNQKEIEDLAKNASDLPQ